jgi:hypothetical protein
VHSWKSSALPALSKPKSSTRCETPGPNIPRSSPPNLSLTVDPVGRAYASNRCSPEYCGRARHDCGHCVHWTIDAVIGDRRHRDHEGDPTYAAGMIL